MNKNTSNHTANQILLGAIERLDKANNPHMKRLQADLVHDLNALIDQQMIEQKEGCFLPFIPRCKSEADNVETAAMERHVTALHKKLKAEREKAEMVELLNSCVHPRFHE